MKLINPWENIIINKINPSSRVHNFDGKVHIVFVLNGSIVLENDDESINIQSPGFYILPKAESYILKSSHTLSYDLALHYSYKKNQGENNYSFEFTGDSRKGGGTSNEELSLLINKLLASYYLEKNYTSDVEVFNLYFSILNLLERKYYKEVPVKNNKSMRNRIDEIKFYIDNNFEKDIKFKEIAKKFFVSEQYLSRIFSEIVGKSLSDYLLEHRIKKVEKDLIETDIPITSIVYAAGFTNINSFNRIFKKIYGISPSLFRKNNSQSKVNEKIVKKHEQDLKELEIILNYHNDKNEKISDKIQIDFHKNDEMIISDGILNIGQAGNMLITGFNNQLKTFEKHSLFTYARVTGLLNEDFSCLCGNKFNFSSAEEVIIQIIDRGWKPFIVINPPENNEIKNSDCSSLKSYSLDLWLKKINDFFRYFFNIYGKSVLEEWKIEVVKPNPWYYENFINLGYYLFKGDNRNYDITLDRDFVKYYDEIKKIIKTLNSDLQVGMGGIILEDSDNDRYSVLKDCLQHNIIPDFLGVSALPYSKKKSTSSGKSAIVKSTKENYLLNMTESLVTLMKDSSTNIDLFLTEFNVTSASLDQLNDMAFKGLYILNNHLKLSKYYKGMGYWHVSDLSFDYSNKNEPEFFGGSGLITMNGIPKIGVYSYEFLDSVGNKLILHNDYFTVTKNDDGDIIIIAYLYSSVDPSYFSSFEKYDIKSNKIIFHNPSSIRVTLQIINLPMNNGNYRAVIKKIGYLEGNALDESLKVTSLTSFDKETIEYLKAKSIPVTYLRSLSVNRGVINFDLKVDPQEIVLIKLKKIY